MKGSIVIFVYFLSFKSCLHIITITLILLRHLISGYIVIILWDKDFFQLIADEAMHYFFAYIFCIHALAFLTLFFWKLW